MNRSSEMIYPTTSLTRTISVTSGKGGVGKTTTVVNLAYQLAQRGKKVLILDGDLGMANVDIMFGKRARNGIHEVLQGEKTLPEIVYPLRENIDLIPGGSGVHGLHQLNYHQRHLLLQQVADLDSHYDFMIIDTAPGLDENVLYLNSAAQQILLVLTPDPSSLTDAYALIKVLNQKRGVERFRVLCNQVGSEKEGLALFRRLGGVCDQFLCVGLDYLGSIPADLNLRQATRSQQLVSAVRPQSPAATVFSDLAEKFSDLEEIQEVKGAIQFFWEKASGVA